MKNLKKTYILLASIFGLISIFSQNITTQDIIKPSEGKSLVYFVRSGAGFALNFRIYDKDKFLGAVSGSSYLVYECEPGEHLFWATSENRDYVEANLAPNSVYVINAEGQMGAFIAGVNLKPLNPNEFSDKKLFYRVIKNDTKQIFSNPTDNKSENIKKGLETYNSLKANKSSKIQILDISWKFENADKPTRN
ncbi:hypothetical protein [Amniculibacterium aquaticum]|uniref:hypothetical protein n=1 Tax=Amniculibacterium aquaticum TaxID=2479858 RepID=UPI000F5AD8E4|nr:hypothetical protein [Amniculibacterium aquaticum]